jgi:hypothetical protein
MYCFNENLDLVPIGKEIELFKQVKFFSRSCLACFVLSKKRECYNHIIDPGQHKTSSGTT